MEIITESKFIKIIFFLIIIWLSVNIYFLYQNKKIEKEILLLDITIKKQEVERKKAELEEIKKIK